MQLTSLEYIFILTCSTQSLKTFSKKSIFLRRILDNPSHCDFILSLASRNGVAQLVYQNLKNINGIPPEFLSRLRYVYLHSSAENLKKIHELLSVLELLKKNGVDAIPIKGALASEIIFNKIGLYHGTDIDILVRPKDLKKAKRILNEGGYQDDESQEKDMLISHYHLVFRRDKYMVEAHWNLVKRYFDIPPEFWWKDTQSIDYSGYEILQLSPEKYLMALIFRLFSHMFYPLKFFVIIDALCSKYEKEMNWKLFLKYIEQYRMRRISFFTLQLLNEIFGTNIPSFILRKRITGYDFFKKEILEQILREKRKSHFGKLIYLFLLDSPFYIVKLILGRVWPNKGEMRLRYGIAENSPKIYLYYLLNPFLLPFLILKNKQ